MSVIHMFKQHIGCQQLTIVQRMAYQSTGCATLRIAGRLREVVDALPWRQVSLQCYSEFQEWRANVIAAASASLDDRDAPPACPFPRRGRVHTTSPGQVALVTDGELGCVRLAVPGERTITAD